jgi:pyruvate ferredoxin oxidoreductase gamma subunit
MTDRRVVDIDATSLAIETLGKPITNTAMLGALLAVSGVVSLPSVKDAIRQAMPASIAEKNCTVVERAYGMVKGE